MMNTRFYNARILKTMNNHRFQVVQGELWVVGKKIVYIGNGKNTQDVNKGEVILWNREIDVKGNVLMPGFKDAHTHSAMTFLRSAADDLPLQEWLQDQIFPREAKLSPENVYTLTKHGIMEYLTSGITANFDMYLDTRQIAKASSDCGFRCVQVGSMNDFGGTVEEAEADYLALNNLDDLNSYIFGFHAEYTTSLDKIKQLAKVAKKYKAPVFTHVSETKREVEECIERYGLSPIQLLDREGIYDNGGGGYHCVWFDDKDTEIFRKRRLSVITNPASNLKLASGIAPIKRYVDLGINIGIGTDGPASNNALDMFREIYLTATLAKVREGDAQCVNAEEVLYMATAGGALAMGLTNCDRLEVGKYADLIMIDLDQPNMQPINNIPKGIVYSAGKQNVKMTMVNGQILYEDQKFNIGVDPEDIYKEVNRIIRSMD